MNTIKLSKYGATITSANIGKVNEQVILHPVNEPLILDFDGIRGIDSKVANELLTSLRPRPSEQVFIKNTEPMVKSVLVLSGSIGIKTVAPRAAVKKKAPRHFNLFGKKTMIFITLLTLLFGFTTNAWAYETLQNAYVTYNTGGDNTTVGLFGQTTNFGDVSKFAITAFYINCKDDWGAGKTCWNGGALYYNTVNSGAFTEVRNNQTNWKPDGWNEGEYKFYKEDVTFSITNSGKYTYYLYAKVWGNHDQFWNCGGSNYKWTFTILPPSVFQYSYNVSGYGSGSGTSGAPYKVAKGGTLTITVNGYNKHSMDNTDSNSKTQVSWDGGTNWTDLTDGSASHDITVSSTTRQSITFQTRNYNSTDKLSSSVKEETIYYIGTEDPTISLAVSSNEIDLGQTITLTPTPGSVSAGGQTYTYQYLTDGGSSYTNIAADQTGASYVWTPSAAGDYKVRIVMTYQTNTYISNVVDVKVYDVYTIKISPKWFANIYLWNSSTNNAAFPGVAVSGEQIGGWYVMQVSSKWEYMIVSDDNSNSRKQSETIDLTSSKCYTLSSAGEGTTWRTTEATCPEAPTTTTNDPTSIQNTSVTLNGTVSSNNEALTDYGFYWGTTDACGTQLQVATADKDGDYSKQLTGLTANTTYYYKAYATNAFGTTYGEVQPFTTKYKVTITDPTNGQLSQTGEKYIDADGISITATPSTGYSFEKWTSTNCNLENETIDGKKKTVTLVPTADNATLTVSFTEDQWPATVSSGAHGSVSETGTMDILQVTGKQLTATADAGYYFTGWTVTGGITPATSTNATETFRATAAGGTITANFAERWVLRGSKKGSSDKGGMPTNDAAGTMSVDAQGVASINVTLEPNIDYQFKILDKKGDNERGQENNATITPNENWKLNGGNQVYLATVGYGTYTISVTVDDDYPKVSYTAPASHQITMAAKGYTNNAVSSDPSNGGTLTAKTTENATDFVVSDGKYVRDGGSVVFTATPKTGYTFAGFYSDASCTGTQITEGVVDNKYTTTISDATSVYAKFTENLTPVTLKINGDGTVKVGDVEKSDGTVFNVGVYTFVTFTTVNGSSTKFNGWTTSTGADFTMEGNTLKGNGAGRTDGQILTANFGELDKIYFYNIGGQGSQEFTQWTTGKVFVYFGVGWDDKEKGVSPRGHDYREMNRIEGTDIYWANIETYFNTGAIAFSDVDMSTNENFHGNRAVYRTDYNSKLNMYVPRVSDAKNTTDYSSNGYWMKYDPEVSEGVGYYLKRQTDDHQYGEFQATANGSHTSFITISVDANSPQTLYIVSAGAQNYGTSEVFDKDHRSHNIHKYDKDWQFQFTPNGTGDYTFKLTQGEATLMSLEIDYPNTDNAYRVVYNNGTKDHPSHAIQPNDKVSFFVNQGGMFRIQQFKNSVWTDVATNLSVPGTVENDGVYIFQLAGDGKSLTNIGAYTGNYYIRTDRAGGGWHNYKGNENNLMVKGNIYGYNNTYDYAYTQWCPQNTNVKYTIANDYSLCISDSLAGDDVIGTDKQFLTSEGANIRFMWDSKTNALKRDYIGGSNNEQFLYIHGGNAETGSTASKLYLTTETASPVAGASFHDDGNWIYSKEFYVEPGAFIALTAKFNDKYQFFYGEGDASTGAITKYKSFVGGESGDKLRMQVIYNFKTNELVAGYIPDGGTISTTIDLNSDLLWIRTQQGEAMPINFSSTEISIKNINKIYGVLELCKDSMTNLYNESTFIPLTNTSYNRINYWISFPFDVKVSDIFGVDGYGEKWVIQYYNGEKRAEIGWFAETSTFWEWLDLDDTMKAGKGYTLNLNTTYFDEATDDVWKNVESKVAFYFPSTETKIGVIKQQAVTTTIPDHAYQYDRYFGDGNKKNHRITDSYWNIIGTPAFQPTTISSVSGQGPKAIYVWKQGDGGDGNGYNIEETMTGFTFQPMRSYIVQYGGEVTWEAVSSIVKAHAPYAYADQKNYMVDLEFYFGEQRDHTYINLSDEATKDFKLNEDVMKMTNSGAPNIYSYAEGYDVAYNEVPMVNQTINLGVIARKNGSYTFAMPKDFSGKAVLVDLEEGTYTDLNVSNYSVDLNKGTYNNRFQLMLKVEASTPTNIDNVDGAPDGLEWNADGKTKKLLINDQIYLINGGRVYNATGVQLR